MTNFCLDAVYWHTWIFASLLVNIFSECFSGCPQLKLFNTKNINIKNIYAGAACTNSTYTKKIDIRKAYTGGVYISGIYAKNICIRRACIGGAYFACIKSAYIRVVCIRGICVSNSSTVERLKIHLQLFQILELKQYSIELETRVETS